MWLGKGRREEGVPSLDLNVECLVVLVSSSFPKSLGRLLVWYLGHRTEK